MWSAFADHMTVSPYGWIWTLVSKNMPTILNIVSLLWCVPACAHRVSEVLHSPLHRLHAQLAHQSAWAGGGGRDGQAGQLPLQLPGGGGKSPLPLDSTAKRRGPGQTYGVHNSLCHGWKIHLCRSKVVGGWWLNPVDEWLQEHDLTYKQLVVLHHRGRFSQ